MKFQIPAGFSRLNTTPSRKSPRKVNGSLNLYQAPQARSGRQVEVDFNPFKNFPGRSAVTRLLENRPFRFPEKVFPLMQRSFLSQRVISIDYEQLTQMARQMLQGGQPGCRFSCVLKPHAKTRTGERRELTSLTAHTKGKKND